MISKNYKISIYGLRVSGSSWCFDKAVCTNIQDNEDYFFYETKMSFKNFDAIYKHVRSHFIRSYSNLEVSIIIPSYYAQ